jgi:hypothetical protein
MYKWLKHSGGILVIRFNPFTWNIIPKFGLSSYYPEDDFSGFKFSFLFLEIKFWIHNGEFFQ